MSIRAAAKQNLAKTQHSEKILRYYCVSESIIWKLIWAPKYGNWECSSPCSPEVISQSWYEHGKTPAALIGLLNAHRVLTMFKDILVIQRQLEMWANAQRDGRPAEYRWRPLFNATVWLTPTTRVPRSNAAKTRNPLKLPGVPQTNETIPAASGRSSPYCVDM